MTSMQPISAEGALPQPGAGGPVLALVTQDRVMLMDLCAAVAEVLPAAQVLHFASVTEALAALCRLSRLDVLAIDTPRSDPSTADSAAHAALVERALARGARLISVGAEGRVPDLVLRQPFTTAMVHSLIRSLNLS